MKILYWANGATNAGTINFSITGEGSVEEECYQDALKKVQEEIPLKIKSLQLQRYANLAD